MPRNVPSFHISDFHFFFQITVEDIVRIAPVVVQVLNQMGSQTASHSSQNLPSCTIDSQAHPPTTVGTSQVLAANPVVDQVADMDTSSVAAAPEIPAVEDSPQATKLTRVIFNELKILFPEKFVNDVVPDSLPPGVMMFKNPLNVSKLSVKPCTSGTWLDPSTKARPSDTVGYWPSDTTFPKNSSSSPAKYRWNPPKRPIDTSYADPRLAAFLEGPILGESVLDPYAFSNPSCNVKGSHQANMDKLLRSCLHESFLDSEYITMLLELVPKIKSEFVAMLPDSDQDADLSFPTLDLLHNLLGLLAHGLHRNTNTQISAYVSNKLSIRDHVLDKLICHPLTKEYLRGSDFMDCKVFGPIPESLQTALASNNASSLICRPKRSLPRGPSPSTSGFKRPAPQRPVEAKRPRVEKPSTPSKPATQFFPGSQNRPRPLGKKSGSKPSPYGGRPGSH